MGLLRDLLNNNRAKEKAATDHQFDAWSSLLKDPNATDEGRSHAIDQMLDMSGANKAVGGGGKGKGGGGTKELLAPMFKHLLGVGSNPNGVTGVLQGMLHPNGEQGIGTGNVGDDVMDHSQDQPTPAPSPSPSPSGVTTYQDGGAVRPMVPTSPAPSTVGVTPNPLPSTQPSTGPNGRPQLLLTASQRLAREQAAYKTKLDADNASALTYHNSVGDADAARSTAAIGTSINARYQAYTDLKAKGVDEYTAAIASGWKLPADRPKITFETRIDKDGNKRSYKVTNHSDGTSEDEEGVSPTNLKVAPTLTGKAQQLAEAHRVLDAPPGTHDAATIAGAKEFLAQAKQEADHRTTIQNNAAALSAPAAPGTVRFWSDNYKNTGQWPPTAILRAQPRLGQAIVTDIANSGDTATAVKAKQAYTAANTHALIQQVAVLNQVEPYEKTASQNLDRMVGLYKGLDTGSPIFNTGYQLWEREFKGSPQLASFTAARMAAINEISNVLKYGKGVISDSAIDEANKMLASNYTLPALVAAAKTLHADMDTRIHAQKDQVQYLRDEMAGKHEEGYVESTSPPTTNTAPKPGPGRGTTKTSNDGGVKSLMDRLGMK